MVTKSKILIVEDDISLLSMYEFKLKLNGFDVRVAVNGQIGLDFAKKFNPDLILLDLKMPVVNGEEMLHALRSHNWGASISVVILTNINRGEAPLSLRYLGVDRYIVKAHTTPSQIVEIVNEVLIKHS